MDIKVEIQIVRGLPAGLRSAGVLVEWLGHWVIVPIGAPLGIVVIYN